MIYCLIVPIIDISGTEAYDKHFFLDIENCVSKEQIISVLRNQISHEEMHFPNQLKKQAGEEIRRCITVLEQYFTAGLKYGRGEHSINKFNVQIEILNEKRWLIFSKINPLRVG